MKLNKRRTELKITKIRNIPLHFFILNKEVISQSDILFQQLN